MVKTIKPHQRLINLKGSFLQDSKTMYEQINEKKLILLISSAFSKESAKPPITINEKIPIVIKNNKNKASEISKLTT